MQAELNREDFWVSNLFPCLLFNDQAHYSFDAMLYKPFPCTTKFNRRYGFDAIVGKKMPGTNTTT